MNITELIKSYPWILNIINTILVIIIGVFIYLLIFHLSN